MKVLLTVILCFAATIQAAPRIVGGKDAPEGKYPYQVSLRRPSANNSLLCGGSILNKRWILTAAHCVRGQKSLNVVAGTNKLNGSNAQLYESEALMYHENFDPILLTNDVGLIRLKRDIKFTERVKPIVLAFKDFTKVDYPANLTGWGRLKAGGELPNNLQEIVLKVIDQKVCREKWSQQIQITKSHICTLTKFGEGACNGDSGGPLVADGVQIGIVSFGLPCGAAWPDVFTRVFTFSNWIKNQIDSYEKSH